MATTTYLQPQPQPLTTEAVEAAWEDILKGIKARDRTLFVLLTSSGGVLSLSVKDNTVRLRLSNEWQVKRIMQDAPRRVIEVAINSHFNLGSSGTIIATTYDLDTLDAAIELFNLTPNQWTLPDEKSLREEVQHLREIIKTKSRHYKALEKQSAKFDMHVPPYMIIGMEDLEEEIRVATLKIQEIKHNMVSVRLKYVIKKKSIDKYLVSTSREHKTRDYLAREEHRKISELTEKINENTALSESLEIISKKVITANDFTRRLVHLDTLISIATELNSQLLSINEQVKLLTHSEAEIISFHSVELMCKKAADERHTAEIMLKDTETLVQGIENIVDTLNSEIAEIEHL